MRRSHVTEGAYPRPRGGAGPGQMGGGIFSGLSPPARGSRVNDELAPINRRPIPARAGEPEG